MPVTVRRGAKIQPASGGQQLAFNPLLWVGRAGYYNDLLSVSIANPPILVGERWYDPLTARWMSKDPIGIRGGDANLYRYVKNQPAIVRDASGLVPIWGPPPASPPVEDIPPVPIPTRPKSPRLTCQSEWTPRPRIPMIIPTLDDPDWRRNQQMHKDRCRVLYGDLNNLRDRLTLELMSGFPDQRVVDSLNAQIEDAIKALKAQQCTPFNQ